jgi:hypothetical protein
MPVQLRRITRTRQESTNGVNFLISTSQLRGPLGFAQAQHRAGALEAIALACGGHDGRRRRGLAPGGQAADLRLV